MKYNRSKDHSDMTLFCNRLWNLMEQKRIDTARGLATVLYDEGLVQVKQKENYNSDEINRGNAIGSVEKKIQAHLKAETPDRLQGEYVLAYCKYFDCSADYLFHNIEVQSANPDIRHFCECTGLSEAAVKQLIDDLGEEDVKIEVMEFWSRLLECGAFLDMPLHFHRMCTELGQYYTADKKQKWFKKLPEKIECEDKFVHTLLGMMKEEYLKEAEPHKGAYFFHLNEIVTNLSECLEFWAEEYVIENKEMMEQLFFDNLEKKRKVNTANFREKMKRVLNQDKE